MSTCLEVRAGQCSRAGVKPHNEDCCGIRIPEGGPECEHKGIVAIVADGVGSSEAGREASEYCVQGFIADYYSTPHSWSVKTSGERIIRALNSWLYAQGQRRYGSDLSLASTLAAVVLKSATAHLFHVGDSRIWLVRDGEIRCLTKDHRLIVDRNKTYLARAMGGEHEVHFDYGSIVLEAGDRLLLTTDGVHEFLPAERLRLLAEGQPPEEAARAIVQAALDAGSDDNLTCQIVEIVSLPSGSEEEYHRRLTELPFPPPLTPGMTLDGYRILRELHASPTVQVYLAEDGERGETVVIKTPSVNFEDDPAYIDRFVHEEWVGQRIEHPNVFRVLQPRRKRSCLYYVSEYLEGQSLAQWMRDHPKPELNDVRDIARQIIAGLRAFHRREMVHQDIKPENIMIDRHRRVKIIDFGSTFVAGLKEIYTPVERAHIEGTANYIAPELFDGFAPTPKSDMFSLAVTLYEMLSGGHFPYARMDEARKARRYDYTPLRQRNPAVPAWMDEAIRKAAHPDPERRYDAFSEFEQDLNRPNPALLRERTPLIERDPLKFWKALALLLLLANLLTLMLWLGR